MEANFFGEVNFRGEQKRFGIKTDDRRRHMYLIGKTGMGKTTTLENMVINDIKNGHGVGIIDPHGEFAEKMLQFVPEERIKDVIYFNPADTQNPMAFNPIEKIDVSQRHLVASGLMGVFKKIWPDVWSARMEYILNNSLLTLLEFSDSTLLDVMRLLSDKDYRKKKVDQLKDPVIKGFWVNEFARYAQKFETEATAAIQNKIGKLVANPLVRHILGQPRTALDFRKAMDEKKILIFNLAKGRIGEDNSALLGSMVITKIQLAAMSRVDIPEQERKDFFLYVDEFQNFATDSFADILSEARKYRLSLILAHQYIGQLTHDLNTKVRDAVFGNVGTMIVFRVGAEDAEFLEKEFEPDFMATDLVNLPKASIYTKLMIDGVASRPFSAKGMMPVIPPPKNFIEGIVEYTRKNYSTPLKEVEEKIASLWAPSEEDRPFHEGGGGGGGAPRKQYSDMRQQPRYNNDRPPYQPRQDRPPMQSEFRPPTGRGSQGGPPRRDDSRQGPPPRDPLRGFEPKPLRQEKPWQDFQAPRREESRPASLTPRQPKQERPRQEFHPTPKPAPKPEKTMSLNDLKATDTVVSQEENKKRIEKSLPERQKSKVDIDDLRKAIKDSLDKKKK